MKVLFLQPPIGSWVYWGKHLAINVSHVQMAACVREWVPEVEVEVINKLNHSVLSMSGSKSELIKRVGLICTAWSWSSMRLDQFVCSFL